jgi:phage-related minor tail protein
MRLLRTGMGIAKAAWNKAQDVVELKRRLAEANARVAELEASVEMLKFRLDDASRANLELARRETRRLVQRKAVEELERELAEIVRQRSLGNRAYDDRLVEIASELHRIAHALKEPAE